MGGVTEVAEILGVSRQRLATLRERPDFPDPIAEIAQGPIWDLDEIQAWAGSGLRPTPGRPSATAAAHTLGGRFVLEQPRVGNGGYADVFRALDRKHSGRHVSPVAVKVLRDVDQVDPNAVRRFRRELRLMENIAHANVVSILSHGETNQNQIWYAMPLAQGSLANSLDEFAGRDALILDLMRQICAGLRHIHEQGIYHRDLKPANILRFEDGIWVISDFGLAVEAERQTTTLTSTHVGLGTQWFTAPEQWKNARDVDQTADIYSLGKVLQALVLGEIPINDDMPPGPWRPLVRRATATRPDQRFITVEAFLSALEVAIEGPKLLAETPEDTAGRLLERIRQPLPTPADLDELAHWALVLDEDNSEDMIALARVLPWISADSIGYLWATDEKCFRAIFGSFSSHVETANVGFEYCDVLANFSRRAVRETDDPEILRAAVRSLVQLGRNHNRWHVRDVVTTILQGITETEHAIAAGEGLRSADPEAAEWALSEFSVRSLHPHLRFDIGLLIGDSGIWMPGPPTTDEEPPF